MSYPTKELVNMSFRIFTFFIFALLLNGCSISYQKIERIQNDFEVIAIHDGKTQTVDFKNIITSEIFRNQEISPACVNQLKIGDRMPMYKTTVTINNIKTKHLETFAGSESSCFKISP
jgi:hypothetical protein